MIRLEKSEIRREIREQKRRLTPAQIEKASAALAEQLCSHPLYLAARSVYGYLSYNQEVLTLPILQQATRLPSRCRRSLATTSAFCGWTT